MAAARLAAGCTPQPMFAKVQKSTKKLTQPQDFTLSSSNMGSKTPKKEHSKQASAAAAAASRASKPAVHKVRTASGTTRYTGKVPEFEDTSAVSAIFLPKENVPRAPKFNLKASLNKPLSYKPHKGGLRGKSVKSRQGTAKTLLQAKMARQMHNISDKRGSLVHQKRCL